jgi:hypothetical protein
MAMTVSQAMTNLETATIRFVGAVDEATGGSQGLAALITMLAEAIEVFTIFARGSSPAIEQMKTQTQSLREAIAATQNEIAKGGLKDLGNDASAAIAPLTEVEEKIAAIQKRLKETGDGARFAAISRIEGGLILQLKEIGELEKEMRSLTTRQVGRGGDAGFTVGSKAQIKATQDALDEARRAYGDALTNLDNLRNTPAKAFIPDPVKPKADAEKKKKEIADLNGYMTDLERLEKDLAEIRTAQGEGATNASRAALQAMLDYLEATGDVYTVLEKIQALPGNILDPSDVSKIEMFVAATKAAQFGSQTAEINKLGFDPADILPGVIEATPTAWDGFEQRIAEATKFGLINAIETGEWGDAFGQILTDVTRDALNNALDVLWEALSQIDWGGQGQGWAGFFNMVGGSFQPRAGGGPVGAGQRYRVGEMGSEWFVPKTDGYIVPNGGMGKSLGAPMQISVGGAQVIIQGDASERTAAMIAESLTAYTRALPGMIDQRVTDRQKRGAY